MGRVLWGAPLLTDGYVSGGLVLTVGLTRGGGGANMAVSAMNDGPWRGDEFSTADADSGNVGTGAE